MAEPNGNTHPVQQNIAMAALFALINACMLSTMSFCAKLLSAYFDPIEITFFRNLSSLVMLAAFLLVMGRMRSVLKTSRPWAHLLRSAIGTAGIIVGMWSFTISPLAVATVLFFTSPLFVVMLSYPVLGEKIGPLRIGGVAAGFFGVGLIAWPAFTGASGDITVLGVVVGISYGFLAACVDICLRWIGRTEGSNTTTFYFLLFGVASTALYWPFSEQQPWDQDFSSLLIIFGLGLSGILSLLAKSQSFRIGQASLIAPVAYTMIIWAGLFDYFVWGKVPSVYLLAGASIVIASNVFILYREHRKQHDLSEHGTIAE